MTNEQLAILVKAGKDTGENMARLYEQVRPFIHAMALHYRGCAETDDLEQEGYLALYGAVDGYDPAAGCLFLTFARHRIRRRMIRFIQNNGTIRIPVHEHARLGELKKLEARFASEAGRKPSEAEIAACMGISLKQVRQLRKAAGMGQTGSLDAPAGEEGETALYDLIPGTDDVEEAVLDEVEKQELKEVLWSMVDGLGGQRAQVIRGKYQEGWTQKELASRLGVAPSCISCVEKEAIRELRKHRGRLRAFLPERLESLAYRGGAEAFRRTWTSSTERAAMRL